MISNAFRKILKGSENSLVEVVSRLIDTVIWDLPIEYNVEVTRNKYQNITSKNCKLQQNNKLKGNRPNLMIQAYL